jgi:hypothetical protein
VGTWRGQKAQIDMAQTRLNINFEQVKEEHALAALNAIEMLKWAKQHGLVNELWDVIEAKGSEYRNKYVDLDKFDGRVRVDTDEDQGLPQSPDQLRETFMELVKEVASGNPIAKAILDVESNQEVIATTLTPGLVLDGAAQRSRTLQHINALLQGDWVRGSDATGNVTRDLPVKPSKNFDDFRVAEGVIQMFARENSDVEQSNPEGWARLNAYYELLKQLEAAWAAEDAKRKTAVQQAGQPQPDPTLQQARQSLLQDAATAAQSATALSQPNPAIDPRTSVQAAKTILDAAIKAAQ